MRKAALITGIVFALITACSPLFKIAEIPGYGLLRVAGTGFFCLFALPLHLLYNLKRNKTGLRRTADIVGILGMWCLLMGLLFKVQQWPGAYPVLLVGIVLVALFGILFFAASREPGVSTEWFNGFTGATVVVIMALGISLSFTRGRNVDIPRQISVYEAKTEELETDKIRSRSLLNIIDTSAALDSAERKRALDIYEAGTDASDDIETIKKKLVLESNWRVGEEGSEEILNPIDTDFTTYFMVGEDVTNPTGNGVLAYENLQYYQHHFLPESIDFGVKTSGSDAMQDQWVKDNFYQATVVEALTRLTQAQIAIQKSIIETLETRAFLEKA